MDFYDVLLWFGRHSAWLLLPAVAIIFLWIFEAKKRPDIKEQEWQRGVNVSTMVKVFSWVGMVYGFFLMIGAVMAEIGGFAPSQQFNLNWNMTGDPAYLGPVNHFTVIIYFVTGAVMFFKPLKDIPFAALISLGVSVAVTIICMTVIPENKFGQAILTLVELKWILIIVFLVMLAIMYALSKIAIGFLMKFSKIVSMPPFAVIYGSFILVQTIMLLFGYSMVGW